MLGLGLSLPQSAVFNRPLRPIAETLSLLGRLTMPPAPNHVVAIDSLIRELKASGI